MISGRIKIACGYGTSNKSKSTIHPLLLFSVIIILTILLNDPANAYTPPIGIPAPTFGINEVAPAAKPGGWPASEVAGHYYIDNTHPSATDTANTYGYPNKPRLTIPEITYPAGSDVEVHGGPYSDNYIYLSFNCTSVKPCWIRGTPASMPVVDGTIYITGSSYVILEYFDFNGGTRSGVSIEGNDHISVRNSQVRNKTWVGNNAGIGIGPSSVGNTVNDVVIYNNNFEELGDWQTLVDQDFHGIVPGLWGKDVTTFAHHIWILDNTCLHLSGNCVQVNAGNWTNSYLNLHHIYIGNNEAHALRQAGFWSKQASDVIISQNTVYDNREHGPQPGDCFGYQYRPNNLWIIFNTCYDANYGVRQSDSTGYGTASNSSYIIGNLFYNIHTEDVPGYNNNNVWHKGVAISLWQGNMKRYVVDNTIYNCDNGIHTIQSGFLEMSGNIISDIDLGRHLFIFQNSFADVNIDYTFFHDASGDTLVRWGESSSVYSTLANFQTNSGECLFCLEDDPLFFAPGSNFDLKAASPAKDAGIEHSAYAKFQSLYGIDIRKDITGVSRPQGAGWDLGAYEESPSEVPATGTTLHLIIN